MNVVRKWLVALVSAGATGGVAVGLTACASDSKTEVKPDAARATAPSTTTPTSRAAVTPSSEQTSRHAKGPFKMGPPDRPRDWEHARLQAAQRMVAANPEGTYTSNPPPILLAIPVLTIELNADGSVRHITVMRYPSQARDTVNTAMAAVRKAAPFGDISRLPKPWKFNETFLFDNDRKFKPMTLDRL